MIVFEYSIVITSLFLLLALYWRIKLLTNAKTVSTDEAFHLYYIELIKENNHHLPFKNNYVLGGPNYCTYPAYYHKLLSYFSLRFLKKYGPLSALLYDVISAGIIIYVISHFYILRLNEILTLISLYLIFPSFIFYSIGPRSYSLTPRNFSQFLCVGGYGSLIFYLKEGDWIFLQISAICYAISFLSSKFTVQYIFFLNLLLSLIFLSFNPIIFLFNIIFWAVLLGRKDFFTQLKGHILHSYWYINDGIQFIEGRWSWVRICELIYSLKIREAWQIIMFHNPFTRGIILNFPIFICFLFMDISAMDKAQLFSIQIIGCSLILWLITQFSFLRAFGEPERYIEYAIPIFLFLIFSNAGMIYFKYFLLSYAIMFYFYSWILYLKMPKTSNLQYVQEVKLFLDDGLPKRILCTLNNESCLFASIKEFFLMGFFSNNIQSKFYYFFYDIYPNVNSINIEQLCTKYKISHVIINKNVPNSNLYHLPFSKVMLENKIYKIIKLNH